MTQETILNRLDRVPPFVIYFLARDSTAKLAHPGTEELAKRSGLSVRKILRISNRVTWAGVTLGDFEKFCLGCGASFLKVSPAGKGKLNYIVRPHAHYLYRIATGDFREPLKHLTKAQRNRFDNLCGKWADSKANSAASSA